MAIYFDAGLIARGAACTHSRCHECFYLGADVDVEFGV